MSGSSKQSVRSRFFRVTSSKRNKKRLVRYGLLAGNLAIVAAAVIFVVRNPNSQAIQRNVVSNRDEQAINPLDTLSAADIAVNAARMVDLPEATSVVNQADSVNAALVTSAAGDFIVAKPQILSSVIKTRFDVQEYVVQNGDTLGSLASKFGVTSDSIKWSNGLSSNTLSASVKLLIPPINGIVYTVKSGDTAGSLATKYNASKDQITAFNDAEVTGLKTGERIVIPGGSIAAPVYVSTFSFGNSAIFGSNGYDFGWCTWYVSNRRSAIGRPVPSNLGNAYSWYRIALSAGLPTGFTPAVGAVMVNERGNHVAVVEQVNGDGSFWVSEMNSRGQTSMTDSTPAGGWGRIDYKLFASAGSLKFIY